MAARQQGHNVSGDAQTSTPASQPVRKKHTPMTTATKAQHTTRTTQQTARPVVRKAASVAGEQPSHHAPSPYAIVANRVANRIAEMAETLTVVQKPHTKDTEPASDDKRRPRKLEMRLNTSSADSVAFSAPFLDNTLQKMLQLQNRMLKTTAELSRAKDVEERFVKEHAAQSAELSRIIAMICAEKARQGV